MKRFNFKEGTPEGESPTFRKSFNNNNIMDFLSNNLAEAEATDYIIELSHKRDISKADLSEIKARYLSYYDMPEVLESEIDAYLIQLK